MTVWDVHLVVHQSNGRNTIPYSALISACSKGRQPKQALKVFQVVRQQGIVLDIITCSALISASEKGKQPECALEVVQTMPQ